MKQRVKGRFDDVTNSFRRGARLFRVIHPVYTDVSQPLEARVEDALARMTLEENVALCHAQSKFS
jgi:hypothetical protein